MRDVGIAVVMTLMLANAASAAWAPSGVDLTRPRLLLRASDVAVVHQRISDEPYRRVVIAMTNRTRNADGIALDDHTIGMERLKARAAKNLAFLYAVDRTVIDRQVVPFPSPAERAAVGERVRDLLVNMYTRSRLAVPAPLGGWDRDISTSEELVNYATAYDTMLGAGFDFGADAATITNNIADLAAELYDNYVHPETAFNFALLHQNNHRSKTGAALVMAGIALAEYTPAPGTDPSGIREPSAWIDYGLNLVDLILRYALATGDGAYGEGPFYLRYTAQNILPFARAWDRLVGRDWSVGDLTIPNMWRHPLFLRSQKWLLDMTLPDGSLAPIDDGNPGRSYYFGAAPFTPETQAGFAWRWINAPTDYEADGNVDLAADSIVNFDHTIASAPPSWSPTAFYLEGGNAILRSDWSPDAVQAIVLGEHDTASEFGRDRDGRGVAPESHEHADPGSFLLAAFGEVLALDPGYLDFGARMMVNQPEHHNLVLVDGEGPVDYLVASLQWQQRDLFARPPADGQATLSDPVDGDSLDSVRVTSRYGQPANRAALVDRRFVFVDNRYLVVADDVHGPGSPAATFTWLLHGNGGGESGGTFEQHAAGGRWTRAAARLDSAIAFDTRPATFQTETAVHEGPDRQPLTHTVLKTNVAGVRVRSMQVLYPTRNDQPPPAVVDFPGADLVLVEDAEADRRILARHRVQPAAALPIDKLDAVSTDGRILVVDVHLDRRLRSAWVEPATTFSYGSLLTVSSSEPGAIGIHLSDDEAELVVTPASASVRVRGLPFAPGSVDGACSYIENGAIVLRPPRSERVILKSASGNIPPVAHIGAPERVAVGTTVTLDGTRGCAPDSTSLTPRWEMVSAPGGSDWTIDETDPWMPTFRAERPGPYRVQLTVTDDQGVSSRSTQALVIAGERCADGIDDDRDGLFDSDDPDCDAATTRPLSGCAADCNNVASVSVADVVRCVNITLGALELSQCNACDADGNGVVAVNEIIAGVNNLLRGCP